MTARPGIRLSVLVLVALAAVQLAFAPVRVEGWTPEFQRPRLRLNLGLDLQGGTRLVLEAQDTPAAPATPDAVEGAMRVIANRIDQLGVTEPTVQRQGSRRIVVELPGVQDPDRAIALIGKTALLEFVNTGTTQLPPGARWAEDGKTVREPGGRQLPLEKTVVLTGAELADAQAVFDRTTGQPVVAFQLKGRGTQIFDEFTGSHIGQYLAIVLDHEVISSPVIRDRISRGRGQISGGFQNVQQAHDLAVLLRGGALPVPVQMVEHRTVGPQLGQDSIERSVRAGYIAAATVALFMALYYGPAGLVADVALGLYILLVLALLAAVRTTLTLPGLAALILSVGMAVDANVIIFEKVKEELRGGKTLWPALRAGWRRAYVTIVDSNVTTLLAAGVLFVLGTGPIRGFAVTLTIGVLVSMFTAVSATRTLVEGASTAGLEAALARLAPPAAGKPDAQVWNILGRRRLGYALSLLIIVPGVIALAANSAAGRGALDWGIDFTGGNFFQLRLERPFSVGEVRQVVDRFAPGESIIQPSGPEVLIRTRPLDRTRRDGLLTALRERFGRLRVLREEEVGPKIGRELRAAAVTSVGIGLLLQVIYIAWRFRSIRYAVAAELALLHDLLVVTGIFALTRKEVNSAFVAVLLTVVGYSVNDTIVVFDRIRENLAQRTREAFDRLVNRSILEALVRSINTAFTTILAIGAVYLFGGATIHDFAFGLMVGIFTGGYSSILNACPVLVDWQLRSERRTTPQPAPARKPVPASTDALPETARRSRRH